MKTTFKILFFSISILVLHSSCSPGVTSDAIFVKDFTIMMDENPTNDQLIGIIPKEGLGSEFITSSIVSQTVPNAVRIQNPNEIGSNMLYVNNASLFDFETHPEIKVTLKVNKVRTKLDFVTLVQLDTKTITATIKLNDLAD
jgi:hypothetical protein